MRLSYLSIIDFRIKFISSTASFFSRQINLKREYKMKHGNLNILYKIICMSKQNEHNSFFEFYIRLSIFHIDKKCCTYLQNGFIDRFKSKVSDVKVHFTHSGFCIKEIVVASQVSFFANYDFDFWVFHVYIDCRKYQFHTTSLM